MNKKILGTLIAGTLLSSVAQASPFTFAIEKTNGKIVKSLVVGNGSYVANLVKMPNGEQVVFFTDPKGDYIIQGNIIDLKNRTSLTRDTEALLNPPADFSEVLPILNQSKAVFNSSMPDKPTLYMFTESLCPYCAKGHQLLEKTGYFRNKNINVMIIPMAFHPGALNVWQAIYDAKDPNKKLNYVFNNFNGQTLQPLQSTPVTPDTKKKLDSLKAVTNKLRVNSTPTYYYKSHGKFVKVQLNKLNALPILKELLLESVSKKKGGDVKK